MPDFVPRYRLVLDFALEREGKIPLAPEQCHYLYKVLRLKDGEHFIALDGKGKSWQSRLSDKQAYLLATLNESTELPAFVTLGIALPKGNGFDDLVRACTELGVNRIIPLITARTLNQAGSNKLERWRKIATEAIEQSQRQVIPIIELPTPLSEALTNPEHLDTSRYICVTRRSGNHLLEELSKQVHKNITLAIGPEGGWTESEIEMALGSGYQPVSLGKTILRTITAPIVAMSIISAHLSR